MHTTTHTKNAFMAAVAVALLLLIGSCYWNPQNGAGKITISLKPAGRAQVDPTVVQYARVYLYADNMNSRINIGDGVPYAEATMSPSGGSMTVDRVPAGSDFKLVLTLGSKVQGVFVPGQFATSETFSVTAGRETTVPVQGLMSVSEATASTYYFPDPEYGLPGKSLVGVATDGSSYVAVSSSTGYFGSLFSIDSYIERSPGATINAVDFAEYPSYEFWLDTSAGIKEYDTSGSPTTGLPSGGPARNVLRSGVYWNGATSGYVVYYISDSGVGGVIYDGSSWGPWVNAELTSGSTARPVFDLSYSVTGSYPDLAFFPSVVGAFGIDSSLLTSGNNDLDHIVNAGSFFVIKKNNKNLSIPTLVFDGELLELDLGTNDGLYLVGEKSYFDASADLVPGETTDVTPYAELVPGTAGMQFVRMAGSYYPLLVAQTKSELVICSQSNPPVVIPLAALALGDVTDIVVDQYGAVILIAGTEGLTLIGSPAA